MSKPGPFSGLKLTDQTARPALDQRLFSPPSPNGSDASLETTKQRNNATTLSRGHETTLPPTSEPTSEVSKEPASRRSPARSKRRVSAPAPQHPHPRSHLLERHSHDIYQDQVRWLNRTKLDLEETFGVKVTGNAMVQLALDRLRRDFEAEGEASELMRVLVFNEPLRSGGEEERS